MDTGLDPQVDPEFLAEEAYCEWKHLTTRQHIQDRFGSHAQPWFRWCFEQFQACGTLSASGLRLLDLGSGSGGLWGENRERLPPGWEIHLGDRSPNMLTTARRHLAGLEQVVSTLELNAECLPFPPGHFSAVTALGLLDHLQNPGVALDEVCRVLELGGWLFASAGSQAHLQEIDSLVRPFLDKEVDLGGDPDRFGVENGAKVLQEDFGCVQMIPYQAEMHFGRITPLLAYLLSEAALRRALPDERCRELKKSLERRLADQGSIQVTLDKALFCAQKL